MDELIKNLYKSKNTIRDISLRIRRRPKFVSDTLKRLGIPIRTAKHVDLVPYSLDHKYFSVIDTHAKAYLLGLLFADGSVSSNSNTISLVTNDIELLENFRKEIKCDKSFYYNPSHRKAITFSFCSPQMKKDLSALGCIPRKSLVLSYPKLLGNFYPSFWLGYFDGDGSLYVNKKLRQFQWKVVSSTIFCEELAAQLQSSGFKAIVSHDVNNKAETSYVRVCAKADITRLMKYCYKYSPFYLNRKHEKYLSLNT